MASKLKYELMASNGSYTKDGEEKKRWQRCGTCFENEKGQLSIKIDAIPVGEWSGWFSLFEPKEQGQDRTPQNGYRQQERTPAHSSQQRDNGGGVPADFDDDGDTIPFRQFNPPLGF